jgi:hypothetical protein
MKLRCKRCNGEWDSRVEGRLPRQCPLCHTPLWNKDYSRTDMLYKNKKDSSSNS